MGEPSEVKVNDILVPMRMTVRNVTFSAHSDFAHTNEFIQILKPKNIILVHGEGKEMERLRNEYERLKHENEVYKLLGAKTSQNTMRQVDFAFKSFFALAKKKANGNYSKKVKIPKYLEKDGYYPLIFDKFSISKGYFKVYLKSICLKNLKIYMVLLKLKYLII